MEKYTASLEGWLLALVAGLMTSGFLSLVPHHF